MVAQLITFSHIQAALALEDAIDSLDAQMRMSPPGRRDLHPSPDVPPRQSAVLILVYPRIGAGLHMILTRRADSLRGHSGQVSFPGGRVDPQDASYEEAALRETCEELGFCQRTRIRIVGRLTKFWIPPSNFDVVPVVASIQNEPNLTPNPAEVADVLHLSLSDLLDDRIKRTTKMTVQGYSLDVPYYDVDGHIVWGATAAMLSELEQRIRIVFRAEEL